MRHVAINILYNFDNGSQHYIKNISNILDVCNRIVLSVKIKYI